MRCRLAAEFLTEPSQAWMRLPLIEDEVTRIGVEYVGLHRDGRPALLLQLDDLRSRSPFSAIVCTNTAAFIGLGCSLYIASPSQGTLTRYAMPGYFGSLYPSCDDDASAGDIGVFAMSASHVSRFSADGALLWQSAEIGIDGVLIDSVTSEEVHGRGEWDPPGGWSPFVLDLSTGRQLG